MFQTLATRAKVKPKSSSTMTAHLVRKLNNILGVIFFVLRWHIFILNCLIGLMQLAPLEVDHYIVYPF